MSRAHEVTARSEGGFYKVAAVLEGADRAMFRRSGPVTALFARDSPMGDNSAPFSATSQFGALHVQCPRQP
jgi:hypothetical protein